jgi:hypothetical protein
MFVITSLGFKTAMSFVDNVALGFCLDTHTSDEDYLIREIITSITKLHSLSMVYTTPLDALIQLLYCGEKCRFLQSLQLTHFTLPSAALLQLLRCCRGTLRSLKLSSVVLEEPAHLEPRNS